LKESVNFKRDYNSNLCFDDILLVPQKSNVVSRHDTSLTMKLGKYTHPKAILELKLPIIASPMDTVCDYKMVNTLSLHGGLGILHRYCTRDDMIKEATKCNGIFGVAVSVKDCYDKEYIWSLIDCGPRVICLDTANGHNLIAISAIDELNQYIPKDIHVMAGNVSTREGYRALVDAGADSVRVGIGGGSACTTRIVTGHGVPTLASIMNCRSLHYKNDVDGIIADGGIRNSGDIVKAFAAGANAVMLGGLLAGYDESPIVLHNGKRIFRGMASKQAQVSWRGRSSVNEGEVIEIENKGSVNTLLEELIAGIKSGCSYTGVQNLNQLRDKSEYLVVSSNVLKESNAHGKF
jgi:IMP dehydrogenase